VSRAAQLLCGAARTAEEDTAARSLLDVEVRGLLSSCAGRRPVEAVLPPYALQASEDKIDRLRRRAHDDLSRALRGRKASEGGSSCFIASELRSHWFPAFRVLSLTHRMVLSGVFLARGRTLRRHLACHR
jgi:hypothetical protein